jgi:NADH dehydrogenase FAD-containing subunit
MQPNASKWVAVIIRGCARKATLDACRGLVAQAALQEGRYVGRLIAKELNGREVKRPFRYEDLLGFARIHSDSLGFTHAFVLFAALLLSNIGSHGHRLKRRQGHSIMCAIQSV